uniref:NADH-ubiquinone oxidoreductase chain 4 n=1 Tax=Scolytinae sp. BMNH 1043133 TaxID=1903798 RepID=A0A343A4U5_9CUCU|nr:NADH dehydrogenase subunit 4 [Scolytinae sp. BMNH 1043133]
MMGVISLLFLILVSMQLEFWSVMYMSFMIFYIFYVKFMGIAFFSNISFGLGIDCLSNSLICLSVWICILMIMASMNLFVKKFYNKLFVLFVVMLLFTLVMAFSTMNLFVFYLFFEMSLVFTLLLILGWGGQPERLMAGMYLLFYTLIVSLPMMISLFYLYYLIGSLEFFMLGAVSKSMFLYVCVNMVFFVKIPMYFIHLWLPKAHVEAPISGSMILAGVMLKLGGYGILRTMIIFMAYSKQVNFLFIIISMFGGVLISMVCLRQSDLKMLIAYSSVSHMGMALSGMLVMNLMGFWGGLVLMLAHGLSSSGLFCMANISYERSHSRSIYLNKGFMNIMPNLSLWWFLLCSSNMSAPPSFNLLGEIMLISSLIIYSKLLSYCLFFLVFYSAAYSLFLYSYTQHGIVASSVYSYSNSNIREYYLLFLHWVPLNLLFLKSDSIFVWV